MEIQNVASFLKYYAKVKFRTKRLFDYIPEENLEWTYKDGKFTIGDIIRHLALTERFMYIENIQMKPTVYEGCGQEFAKGYKNTIKLYENMYQESINILSKLKDEDLNKKCQTAAGVKVSIWKLLRVMVEHEIHHRGNLYTYLGILDIKTPPIFGMTSEEIIIKYHK